MDAQLFNESLELSTESHHWPALTIGDGNKNVKLDVVIFTSVEIATKKL